MTVSTELSHEEYTGNGVTTDFDFRFRIFEAKHLIVSVADTDGTERILTNGTDYTLRGVGAYRGGKVILKTPLAQCWKIGIARDLPAVQETDLRNQGKFFAEVHEDAFDYLTMLVQKMLGFFSLCLRKPSFIADHYDAKGDKISNLGKPVKDGDAVDLGTMKEHIGAKDKRSLRVADKDIPALPNAANRANKLLSFDNDGNPVVAVPESGSAADVLNEIGKDTGYKLVGGITENFIRSCNTVNDLILMDIFFGDIIKTKGLRSVNDGGHAYYKIVSPNDSGIKITEYPNEFGDIKLSNGNVAKRISEIKTQDGVRYWAHRGGQRDVAENTLFSFQQAIDNGAYGVELDCSMSSDGIWYAYHDASLYLQTNGTDFFYNRDSAYIDSLTFNKMKSSVYGNYIRIPKFSDFLKWAKNNGIQFTVEFKNPRPSFSDSDIASGIQMIVDAGCDLQSHVQVTTDKLAYIVRDISNEIKISYSLASFDNDDKDISQICRTFNNLIIQSNSNAINDSFVHGVKLALAMGSDVICYTSNDKEDNIKKILSSGVRNIISDRGWENKQ